MDVDDPKKKETNKTESTRSFAAGAGRRWIDIHGDGMQSVARGVLEVREVVWCVMDSRALRGFVGLNREYFYPSYRT